MAERVHLDREFNVLAFFFAQMNQAVEERLPIPISREIIVRDKETLDVLGIVLADNALRSSGRAEAAFASLHIDDRAKRTLVRTSPAEVEARHRACGAANLTSGRSAWADAHVRQVGHVIVKGLEIAVESSFRRYRGGRPQPRPHIG